MLKCSGRDCEWRGFFKIVLCDQIQGGRAGGGGSYKFNGESGLKSLDSRLELFAIPLSNIPDLCSKRGAAAGIV